MRKVLIAFYLRVKCEVLGCKSKKNIFSFVTRKSPLLRLKKSTITDSLGSLLKLKKSARTDYVVRDSGLHNTS